MPDTRAKRRARELGFTYAMIAREIGITVPAVSEIMNNRTRSATSRYAVAKALRSSVEELWPEGERPKTSAVPQ